VHGGVLEPDLGDRDAEGVGEPLGRQGAMAPLPGPGAFEADQDRHAAIGEFQELIADPLRIQDAEDFDIVEAPVFVERDGIEPWAGGQFPMVPASSAPTPRLLKAVANSLIWSALTGMLRPHAPGIDRRAARSRAKCPPTYGATPPSS
jgi:hypothetical protein